MPSNKKTAIGCYFINGLVNVLIFALFSVKRGSVGNTRLKPHAKMLLVPMNFFSLTGKLCSGGKRFHQANVIFVAYFIQRGRDTHIDLARLHCFWSAWIALWCKSIFFDLFWNVKLFIAQAAQAHYMNADVTLACKRCCVTKCVFSALQSWWNPTCERLWALNLDALPHFIGHTPAVADADLQKEK